MIQRNYLREMGLFMSVLMPKEAKQDVITKVPRRIKTILSFILISINSQIDIFFLSVMAMVSMVMMYQGLYAKLFQVSLTFKQQIIEQFLIL